MFAKFISRLVTVYARYIHAYIMEAINQLKTLGAPPRWNSKETISDGRSADITNRNLSLTSIHVDVTNE